MASKQEAVLRLEQSLREYYPEFTHVDLDGVHYVGRYDKHTMDAGNTLATGGSYSGALRDAILMARREKDGQVRQQAKDRIESITVLVYVSGRPAIPWTFHRNKKGRDSSLFTHLTDLMAGKLQQVTQLGGAVANEAGDFIFERGPHGIAVRKVQYPAQ